MNERGKKLIITACALIVAYFGQVVWTQAINSPTQSGGSGSGAIATDADRNALIGASIPGATAKFIVVGSSTGASDYGLQVLNKIQSPLLIVRDDGWTSLGGVGLNATSTLHIGGNVLISGTIISNVLNGTANYNVPAAGVLPGVFAPGPGNFAFRSSLVINNPSTGWPAELFTVGSGLYTGGLVVGAAVPVAPFAKTLFSYAAGVPVGTSTAGSDFHGEDVGASSATSTVFGMVAEAQAKANGGLALHSAYGLLGVGLGANDGSQQTPEGIAGQTLTAAGDKGYSLYAQNYFDGEGYPSTGGTQYGMYIDLRDNDVLNYGIFEQTPTPNYFAGRVGVGSPVAGLLSLYVKSAPASSSYLVLDTTDVDTGNAVQGFLFEEGGVPRWALAGLGYLGDMLVLTSLTNIPFTISQSSGSIGIGTLSPQSALHVASSTYAQFEQQKAGAPPAADCAVFAHRGRWAMDTVNNRLYICAGTSTARWSYVDTE